MDFRGTDSDDVIDAVASQITDWSAIYAGAGNDTVTAGSHNVELGGGSDTLIGSGSTSLIYWNSPAGVRVDVRTGTANDGFGSTDQFSGVNNVMGSSHGDYFIGSDRPMSFWMMAGHDTVEGATGRDVIVIQTASAAGTPNFTRSDGRWVVSYSSSWSASNTVTLSNGGYIREWVDSSIWRMWDLTGDTARRIPDQGSVFTPIPELPSDGWWKLGQWNIASAATTETYAPYYYPTLSDYHPSGTFAIDAHNATVGDFNADGRDDILINWTAFPHTVERQLRILPAVLLNGGDTLGPQDAGAIPSTLQRHMAYRTVTGDFNGDGIDDFAAGGMGVITRDPSAPSGYVSRWEPAIVATSRGNGTFTDVSSGLAGQTVTQASPNVTFMHDFSAGDVNGDHIDDVFGGGALWLSSGPSQWQDATSSLTGVLPGGSPMSSAIGDLDGIGGADLVALYPDFRSHRVVLLNSGTNSPTFQPVALPEGLFGSNTKDNHLLIADINRDGKNDIIIAETRASPYYVGAAIQLLVQTSPGVFEDQTAARIDNSSRDATHGEGVLFFRDANGDGHPDIIHVTGLSATRFFLNDGTGRFTLIDDTVIPYIQRSQLDGWQDQVTAESRLSDRAYPMHINDDGIIDLVAEMARPTNGTAQPVLAETALYTLVSNPDAFGRGQSEALNGSNLDDVIYGLGGDDSIAGAGGNDSIDGGTGEDTALYTGARWSYRIERDQAGYTILDTTGAAGQDRLTNIEQLQIGSDTLLLSYNDVVQQLYVAYFGRPADSGALANFSGTLQAYGAPTGIQEFSGAYASRPEIQNLVDSFGMSTESQNLYSGNTEAFVTAVFQNVLNRAPQAAGLAFWSNAIESGSLSRGNAALTIMAGALANSSAQGQMDTTLIQKKIMVASNFTFALDMPAEVDAYRGRVAAAAARDMLVSVSGMTDTSTFTSIIGTTIDGMVSRRSAELGPREMESTDIALIGTLTAFDPMPLS